MSKKTTKRSLLASVMALALCVIMLVGTTFAWFTDTASTSVNKIQAGKLDVALEIAAGTNEDGSTKWVSAEGETLQFKKAAGHENEAVLWEPGCTYELPALRVVNKGNLALKYKIEITGIDGDAKLNEAIDWTIGDVALGAEQHLIAGASSEFTIKGQMQTTAGNEYQGLTIDGIGITVYATQDTVEYDSFTKEYDQDAKYPAMVSELKATYGTNGLLMPAGVEITDEGRLDPSNGGYFTITLKDEEAFVYFTQVFDRAAAFEARKAIWGTEGFTKYPSEFNGGALNMWYGPYCHKVTVKMDCDVDMHGLYVESFDGFNEYVVNFDGNGHTIKNAKLKATSGRIGFFASKVNVSNVTLDNIQVSAIGCDSAGVVAGSANAIINNVTVKNCFVIGGKYAGAIAGYSYDDFTNCIVENTVVSGQYKVGGIVGYVCSNDRNNPGAEPDPRMVTGNKLTDVTVMGENLWKGKTEFIIGNVVGNWDAQTGECKNNTFNGTLDAQNHIGEIESGCSVTR